MTDLSDILPEKPNSESIVRSHLDLWIERLGNVLALLFLLSGAIIVFEVVARYVFNAPTMWGHETTMFLCGLLFVYGGNYCLARDKHIRIVLIYGRVSPPVKRIFDIVISSVGLVFAVLLTYAAYTVAEKAAFTPWGDFRLETSGSAWDPAFPALTKIFMMVMLGVMVIQFLLHIIYYFRSRPNV